MAVRVYAGQFDRRVIFCTNAPTTNDDGQLVESESEQYSRWAKVLPRSGVERRIAEQLVADTTHLVQVRSDSKTRSITPQYWLKLPDGTRLDIVKAYDLQPRRIIVELECRERD